MTQPAQLPAQLRDVLHAVPRASGFDDTISLLLEGYRFLPSRSEQLHTDAFATRLMLRPVLCVRGEDAARMFYHPGRFTRRGALPPTALSLLQDRGSALTLDGEAHRRRKEMLMSLLAPLDRQRLAALAEAQWRARFLRWQQEGGAVHVHRAAEEVLCHAVCHWAGIPVDELEARRRAAEFSAMIAGAGSSGPRNWRAQLLRHRSEQWARALVDAVRAGQAAPPFDSALNVIARHRDTGGRLLDRKDAAVELVNLLRPTVAVARFIVFGVLALHAHPDARTRIAAGDEEYLGWFVQEVRRFYPFFPAVGGRALHDFDWNGMRVAKGTWVLLDLYGTNHHPALWGDPEVFRPERFAGRDDSHFGLIPQGGGDHHAGHRCAGELLTTDLMASALSLFAGAISYAVPPQDLSLNLRRMPALPASGMLIAGVRALRTAGG